MIKKVNITCILKNKSLYSRYINKKRLKKMQKKIKEIQDYFTEKLTNGDFEIVKFEKFTTDLLVDKKFPFKVWTSNGAFAIDLYSGNAKDNTMYLQFDYEQRKKLWGFLENRIKEWKETALKDEKIKQFNALKLELGL